MYGRVIQWMLCPGNTEKACALLKGLVTKPANIPELLPGAERSVLFSVINNILCQLRTQTRHISQQMLACSVEVDPNLVDTAFNYLVKAFPELALIDIMLVLTHTDRFRINLNQLGQGVGQPPADGDGTAYRHIVTGKLIPCCFGSGIY